MAENIQTRQLLDNEGVAFSPKTNEGSVYDVDGVKLSDKLESKQDKLVSGTNIKTVNNASLLGSGNIDIAPTIGENGHWYINGVDTGKPSRGEDGVSLGEISLVQDLGTDPGSEGKVISQKGISLKIKEMEEKEVFLSFEEFESLQEKDPNKVYYIYEEG